MTKVYLIRHAEAEGNVYRRVHGWYDSLITGKGQLQIAALALRFQDIHIDAVYSSDLTRTCTTAEAIYRPKGLPLHKKFGLREVNLGDWEDRTWGEAARDPNCNLGQFTINHPDFQCPNGDSFQSLRTRVAGAIREIVARHPDQTVAIFCHGSAIRNALAELQGISVENTKTIPHGDNTCVSYLEFEGDQIHVGYFNDNSHLTGDLSTMSTQTWWKEGAQRDPNLWFRPMDLEQEEELYRSFRREAWTDIHGEDEGYDEDAYYQTALAQWKLYPNSVFCAMQDEDVAGLIQLDYSKGAQDDMGYVPFVYMAPDFRKQGLGAQLIGQAISCFRPMGYKRFRLRCAPDNGVAQRFYRRHGFHKVGNVAHSATPLDMLEKYIGYELQK